MKYSIKINIIVAASDNNVIGHQNRLLWHLPNDFKYFKNTTLGHSILMGRKTFESIGKALPERRNIVITRDKDYQGEDIDVANSLHEAINYCRDEREVFVIGGGQIYKEALPLADKIFLTRVHGTFEGKTRFPELNPSEWKKISEEKHGKDEKHDFDYSFEVYTRV